MANHPAPPPLKSKINTKILLLIGLVALIIVSVALQWKLLFSPKAVQSSKPAASNPAVRNPAARNPENPKTSTGDDPVVGVSSLKVPQIAFQDGKRNLFAFGYIPPPAPPPPPKPVCGNNACEGGENWENCLADCPKPPPPPVPVCGNGICDGTDTVDNCPGDCPAPPVATEVNGQPVKYIGYILENGAPVAFFTNGKEVFMGRENEIIANKFRIKKITEESVEVGDLKLRGSTTLQFQGNAKS